VPNRAELELEADGFTENEIRAIKQLARSESTKMWKAQLRRVKRRQRELQDLNDDDEED